MFPPTTTGRPPKRSFRELVREAIDTAAAFATLGEAGAPVQDLPRASSAPTREHPHRRPLGRHPRRRRPGPAVPRAQVCVTPVTHRPARRD
ncbi:MAG TPA: hypothetical protein VGD16_00255 [Enterovirga sp.]